MSIAGVSELTAVPSRSFKPATVSSLLAETALDILPAGIVLVDANCRILHKNAAAREMLSAGAPVVAYRELLRPSSKAARPRLLAAVQQAASGVSQVDSVPLPYSDGRVAIAHVRSLAPRRQQATAGAAIFIAEPQPPSAVPLEALSTLFRLTKSELRVLEQIVAGHNRRETAAVLDISDATVATHLRGIFLKTATSDQQGLCRKVAALSWPLRV